MAAKLPPSPVFPLLRLIGTIGGFKALACKSGYWLKIAWPCWRLIAWEVDNAVGSSFSPAGLLLISSEKFTDS